MSVPISNILFEHFIRTFYSNILFEQLKLERVGPGSQHLTGTRHQLTEN